MPNLPNDIATQVVWTLNSPTQGKGRLWRVEDYSLKNEAKTVTANEVGSDIPAGFIDTPGAQMVSLKFHTQQGDQLTQFDFDLMESTKEYVTLTMQIVGGRRYQFLTGRVRVTSRDGDADGKHATAVDITCLAMVPL